MDEKDKTELEWWRTQIGPRFVAGHLPPIGGAVLATRFYSNAPVRGTELVAHPDDTEAQAFLDRWARDGSSNPPPKKTTSGYNLAAIREIPSQPPPPPADPTAVTTTNPAITPDQVRAESAKRSLTPGQQPAYIVLTEAERRRGFVEPVRRSYRHVGAAGPQYPLRDLTEEEKAQYGDIGYVKFEIYPHGSNPIGRFWTQAQLDRVGHGCNSVTTMGDAIAETYARSPEFYGQTFCHACDTHLPVGKDGEFVWEGTTQRVGTRSVKQG